MIFNIILILYKIIIFALFKGCDIVEYCEFYVLRSNNFIIILHSSQNQYYSYKENKKNYIYRHQYNNSNKASYQDSVYIVKPGDTLFYIAWITGNNYLDLVRNNDIKDIHELQIDQILKVKSNTMKSFFLKKKLEQILLPFYNSYCKVKKIVLKMKKYVSFNFNKIENVVFCEKKVDGIMITYWNWPTRGVITNTFSDTEGGNTGIDISGVFDQPVLATTNGQVVYVGNVLKGYGNLVIIKHDNHYFSTYAHNNKVLVSEQQYVKVGDQIATMGYSGTNEVKLHFEIRHKGKSINPLCLLP